MWKAFRSRYEGREFEPIGHLEGIDATLCVTAWMDCRSAIWRGRTATSRTATCCSSGQRWMAGLSLIPAALWALWITRGESPGLAHEDAGI